MTSQPLPVDEQSMRILTDELAQQVLNQVAPEELVLYDETAQEYYADPQALLDPKRRDEALGFGLELAMLTPVVIAVAQSVMQWLAGAVVEAAVKESSPSVVSYLRRLFRGADKARPGEGRAHRRLDGGSPDHGPVSGCVRRKQHLAGPNPHAWRPAGRSTRVSLPHHDPVRRDPGGHARVRPVRRRLVTRPAAR